jgi:tetratricopeptide (TPR) repeat protein
MEPVERKFAIAVVAAFAVVQAWLPQLRGAISGKVTDVTDQTATVSLEDAAAAPAIDDSVEIFFNLAGADVEVSVASGKVISVERGTVKVRIERATGEVAKNQFARITSQKTNATAESSSTASPTSPKSSPAVASEEAIQASLTGKWAAKSLSGLEAMVVFKKDRSVIVPLQEVEGAFVRGKYSIDAASSPARIVITGIEVVPSPQFSAEELKDFQRELEKVKQFQTLPPDIHRARHLNQPVKDALMATTWVGEIVDPNHIRIQGFIETDAAAHPQLGPDAIKMTKLVAGAEEPVADFNGPQISPEEQAARARRKPMDEAIELYNRGDFDDAIAIYTKIIEAQPNDESAYWLRANSYEKKSNWSKAMDDLNHAIDLNRVNVNFRLERAEVRTKLQDFDAGLLEDCNKVIALDQRSTSIQGSTQSPANDNLRSMIGKAYLYRGMYYAHKADAKSAEADWDRATVLYPALQKEVDENRALIPESPRESPIRPKKRPH